jgi:enamine deaminase RidA (YjgF/YER057c/UK114 family)
MTFQRTFTGAPWEDAVGYCRALRAGNHVYVTGTAPIEDDGTLHGAGDPLAQARRCLEIIKKALASLGLGMDSVVRTRMFVTDIDRWEEFATAHREVFHRHPPTTTMVEVSRLIHPAMLIEIEADAVVSTG